MPDGGTQRALADFRFLVLGSGGHFLLRAVQVDTRILALLRWLLPNGPRSQENANAVDVELTSAELDEINA